MMVTPSGIVDYKNPMRTARNITHRGQAFVTGTDSIMGLLIFYNYIEFTNAELGFLLARRQ